MTFYRNSYRRPARTRTAPIAEVLAFHEANPIMANLAPHMEEYGENTFLRDLLRKTVQYGSLSPAQLAAAQTTMDRDIEFRAQRQAESAAASPVPTGRIEIEGEVLSIRDKGWGLKMIVKHADGWKVWGSVPKGLTEAVYTRSRYIGEVGTTTDELTAAVGDIVKFTATISASDDDPAFGFFKRPTAGEVIARGA